MDPLANVSLPRKLELLNAISLFRFLELFKESVCDDEQCEAVVEGVDPKGLIYVLREGKKADCLKAQTCFYSIADLCISIAREHAFDNVAKHNEEEIIRMLDKMKPDYQQHQRKNMQKFVRSL